MNVKETIIFVDLDNTLIDSKKVNKMVNTTVCKITKCQASDWERYCEYNKNSKIKNFPKSLISFCQIHGYHYKDVCDYFDYTNLVFKGAINTLTQLKQNGKLYLFTEGDAKIQKAKIKQLSLSKYFDEIIISKDKVEDLTKHNLKNKNLIFIDDKPINVEKIKEKHAAKVFWINNGYYPYQLDEFKIKPDFVIKSINQVPKILEKV